MTYECWDGWNVVLVIGAYVPRFECVSYYQFPIEPRFQGE